MKLLIVKTYINAGEIVTEAVNPAHISRITDGGDRCVLHMIDSQEIMVESDMETVTKQWEVCSRT